ncbi:MAG: prolipoprotein diacylglyceryl transferase [Lachnospiraceae bacterium]|nr:prolipoprotein diacylglyceryl transferase [Lachnospiraceae bacterium]
MGINDIAFPNLGIYLDNVGRSFSIFGFRIFFYGILIGLGILSGVVFAASEAKRRNLNPDIIWDLAIYEIFFSIVGARIYFVATSWDTYKDHPIDVFNLRLGGIAIYGAIIAAFITLFVYCKIKKIKFFVLADTLIMGLVIGQIIGRWGNFFNREVFGDYSNGLFAMRLPIDAVRASDISVGISTHIIEGTNYIQVHPTFLYEAAWNLLLLLFLWFYRKHKRFEGELFFIYLIGYGVGRFFIEAIRTDQLFIPGTNLPISMVVGAVSAVGSVIAILVLRKKLPQAQYLVETKEEEKKTN